MSTGEIVIAALTAIGLLLGIVKVWIQNQTDVAKIQVEILNIIKRCEQSDKALDSHKTEEHARYEEMRRENREDHQEMFKKIDQIILAKKSVR